MAAAAYAALVSLMHLLEHIQMYNARQRIFIDEHQRQLETLREKVYFLQDFLESYRSRENDGLEDRIREAANAAEDVIELYVLLDVHNTSREEVQRNRISFLEILPGVIQSMDFVQKQVMEIKKESKLEDQPLPDLAPVTIFSGKNDTVGLDNDFVKIVYALRGKQHSKLQIIPITGMGGIGKTTLAKLVYDDQSVEKYFDIRDWITMSQECDVLKILRDLAYNMCLLSCQSERESLAYRKLGDKLYKHLYGRRYLIVLDDMWSLDAWDDFKLFLPDNNNGSRIIVTSRLSYVANYFHSSCTHKMELLDDDTSWSLLCRKVFPEESCPPKLEVVGKEIARSCKGLPLSIVVIGGLLEKSRMNLDYWEHVAKDVSSMVINSENNDHCFKILSLSYKHLPIYLKPCFLYIGVFPEDVDIRASRLIKLWVGEGFLKPKNGKILEEVAHDNLEELIDRNLLMVSSYGSTGRIKFCRIHDLLRRFCIEKAWEEMFLLNSEESVCPQHSSSPRIAIDCMPYYYTKHFIGDIPYNDGLVWQSTPLLRSLIYNGYWWKHDSPQLNYKLLRVLYSSRSRYAGIQMSNVVELFNLRFFEVAKLDTCLSGYSLHRFWNLQTLSIQEVGIITFAPSEIWDMPQLRHVMINGIYLRDPPDVAEMQDSLVLENLQTLRRIINFRFSENVLKRMPNINRLRINYEDDERGLSHYGINNLVHLHQLQSLTCSFLYNSHWPTRTDLLQNLHFPSSLIKLNLRGIILEWEDITTKIGFLPNLEKLVLNGYFTEEVWNPVEGQFLRLKFLSIQRCNLAHWTAESTHFPSLVHLFLDGMTKLEDIPFGLGEIVTLKIIHLESCNDSLIASTDKMLEEQRDLGNEDIRLLVTGGHIVRET